MNLQRLDQMGPIVNDDLKYMGREAKALRNQLKQNPPPDDIEYQDHYERSVAHLEKFEKLIPAAKKVADACTAAELALVATRNAGLDEAAVRNTLEAAEASCLELRDRVKQELADAESQFNESQPN